MPLRLRIIIYSRVNNHACMLATAVHWHACRDRISCAYITEPARADSDHRGRPEPTITWGRRAAALTVVPPPGYLRALRREPGRLRLAVMVTITSRGHGDRW